MGQKVNPHGLRVGVIKDWDSKWYAEGENFSDYLVEDYNIRKFLKKKLYAAGVSKIEIERAAGRVKVTVYTAKPGVVIGKGGAEIDKIKTELQKQTSDKLVVDIKEIKRPDRDAQLVAENIAGQLENRVSFRRAMKSCMGRSMKTGIKGIKTSCSGRLGGADMARTESYNEGTIPLQTILLEIYCHCPMNALITKLLHLCMKHRHVAVADNPFRVFCKLCEIEFIDNSDGSIAATNTQNRINVVSVEIILQHACTKVVIACKLVILSEQAVVVNGFKAFFFNPFNGSGNLFA